MKLATLLRRSGTAEEFTADDTNRAVLRPEDADAAKGLISTTSPIGRALLNSEEGDLVKVTTPNGAREFEIVKLVTIHDASQE